MTTEAIVDEPVNLQVSWTSITVGWSEKHVKDHRRTNEFTRFVDILGTWMEISTQGASLMHP